MRNLPSTILKRLIQHISRALISNLKKRDSPAGNVMILILTGLPVRNKDNLKETIAYDNAICLNCHSDFNQFQLLTDKEEINIIQKHDWLPNQAAHFANVRCIECHTQINNKIPVSHLIKPKTEAVKLCNECHSQNSILMASLYKFESKEQRRDGFFNGIILN